MKVVLTRASGPLEGRLVPRLLAAGHDVRVLAAPEGVADQRALPVGVRRVERIDEDTDAVVTAVGRLDGVRPGELDRLAALAASVATVTDRAALLVVARAHLSRVERILEEHARRWTLQGVTVLHDDVDELFVRRSGGPSLSVPSGVALQPVDAAEVADRVVRLVRAEPAGRVPDFGGPSIRLVDELACAWVRSRNERCRVDDVDLDDTDGRWPGAWLAPRRTSGTVEFEHWLAAHRATAAHHSA
jgi:hypothetical protein